MFCVFCVFCGDTLSVCLFMSVVVFSHGIHGIHRMLGCVIGSVGMAGMPYPPNLCASVPICGRHFSVRMFCVFRVFCGNSLPVCFVGNVVVFSHGFHGFPQMVRLRYWRRGYGRMPYPPNLCLSVGGFLCQNVLCVLRILWGICTLLCWCSFVGALETSAPPESAPSAIRFRPPPDQIPSATQSVSVRRPIRFRSPPD